MLVTWETFLLGYFWLACLENVGVLGCFPTLVTDGFYFTFLLFKILKVELGVQSLITTVPTYCLRP